MPDLKLLRFRKIDSKNLLGSGDIQINDVLVLRGVMLLKGKKGNFVSPPQRENNGKYYDVGFSFAFSGKKITDASQALNDALVKILEDAYEKDNSNTGGSGKASGGSGYNF